VDEVRLVAIAAGQRHVRPVHVDVGVRLREGTLEAQHAAEVLGGHADLGLEAFDEPLGTQANRVGDRAHPGRVGPPLKAREREAHGWMCLARPPPGQERALHHVERGVGRGGFEQGATQARGIARAPQCIERHIRPREQVRGLTEEADRAARTEAHADDVFLLGRVDDLEARVETAHHRARRSVAAASLVIRAGRAAAVAGA
jgi:hypothetical protein